MSKNIYEILNNSNVELNEYKVEELNDIEKAKMKSNFRKSIKPKRNRKAPKIAAAVALGLAVGLFATNTGNNVLATINIISEDIASRLGIEKNLDEYKTVVNKSITKNGITIQLNEVILNGDELIVSSTLKSNEPIGEHGINSYGKIYINGKLVDTGAAGGAKAIDNYTMEETLIYDINSIHTDKDLNIKIRYSNVSLQNNEVKGPWEFEFKSSGEELALATKELDLGYSFTLESGEKIILNKYKTNDIGQKIYYTAENKAESYDMVLRGNDDLGNPVEFYLSRGSKTDGVFKNSSIDGNISSEAKELRLTPYAVKFPEKSGRLSNDFVKVGEEFNIDLTKLK